MSDAGRRRQAEAALSAVISRGAAPPGYRERCVQAIRLADELGQLSLSLDNMLAGFVRSGPSSAEEAEAFDRLWQLYERHRFTENAREALTKLVSFDPSYPGAAERLAALPPAAELAELAELPALSDAPGIPTPRPTRTPPEAATDDGPPLREGVLVAGRYRLEAQIGSGGASVVFRASDQELGDAVAVKVFTQASYDPVSDARQQRELLLSRQLVHPNVVRVFEMGRSHGFRYLTMELLEGRTLAERLRAGQLPLDEALSYLAEACAGLQAAHDLGVIHRDVKPANCFVQRGGGLKLMDFGIARVRDTPGLTTTGMLAGTPAYMAPEQASDFRYVSPATDIYSLGVVAYEMLTASLPFEDDDPIRVLERHRSEPPRSPRDLNSELPEAVERLILRCLEKAPELRFGSCRELGAATEALRIRRH